MNPQFTSPLVSALFELGRTTMQDQLKEANLCVPSGEPDVDFDRWADAREGERPVTLPTASHEEIEMEWGRLEKRGFRGVPHEL
jgi:hypothetical protein